MAIRRCYTGSVDMFCKSYKLSTRESELVQGMIEETSKSKDLAKRLEISVSTINNHFKAVFKKMGVNSKNEILRCYVGFCRELSFRKETK